MSRHPPKTDVSSGRDASGGKGLDPNASASRAGTPDSSGGWPGRRPFIGRRDLLQILREELAAVGATSGRVVFIAGEKGCGKTALAQTFERSARRRHWRLRSAYADAGGVERGGVWRSVPVRLTVEHRVGRTLRRTGGEWLGLIPIIGDLLEAAAATVRTARSGPKDRRRQGWERAAERARLKGARALLELGARDRRLLILDGLDRGTAEDLAGAAFLIGRISETRTLLVITHAVVSSRAADPIEDLALQAERATVTTRLRVHAFSAGELGEAVAKATHSRVPARWSDWLASRTGGNPAHLWSVMGELAQAGFLIPRGRAWEWRLFPPDGKGLPAPPIEERPVDLPESDLALLARAVDQGETFQSIALATATGLDELEVEDRLAALVRAGILDHEGETSVGTELSSIYRFRDAATLRWLRGRSGPAGQARDFPEGQ